MSNEHIDILRTIHELQLIEIASRYCPAYEMKPPDKMGQCIGLFCLTLSDISAAIYIY